jgi:hypothetical protein
MSIGEAIDLYCTQHCCGLVNVVLLLCKAKTISANAMNCNNLLSRPASTFTSLSKEQARAQHASLSYSAAASSKSSSRHHHRLVPPLVRLVGVRRSGDLIYVVVFDKLC